MVRTCLGSLRMSLSPQDPHQHTIDQLEQAVASLVDLTTSLPRDPSPTINRRHHSRNSKHVSIIILNSNLILQKIIHFLWMQFCYPVIHGLTVT